MDEGEAMSINSQKILDGRNAIDTYRTAHANLHEHGWHKDIPEEHTPLLKALVSALEGLGFTSTETEFEPKKNEILAKFWDDSNLENFVELGFIDRQDFDAKIAELNKDAEKHIEIDEEGNEYEVIEDTPEAKALRKVFDGMWH